MKKLVISITISSLVIFFLLSIVAQARSPIPDKPFEDALLYRNGYTSVLSLNSIPFFLHVSSAGTGYLADSNNVQQTGPTAPRTLSGSQDSFNLDKNRAWTKLSKTAAIEIWGKPQEHCSAGATLPWFYTFDAEGSFNSERNLYHIDLRFDAREIVFAYRIRGIGICDAKWVIRHKDQDIKTSD